jgi:chromosome segregation ATPase
MFYHAVQEKLSEAAQQLATVQVQLKEESARTQQLAGQLKSAQDMEKESLAKLAAAAADLETQKLQQKELGGREKELQREVDALRQALDDVSKDKDGMQKLSKQLAERDAKLAEVRVQLDATTAINADLSKQVVAAQAQLQQVQATAAAASKAAAASAQASPELQRKLQEATTAAAVLNSEVAQLKAALSKREAEATQLEKKLAAAESAAAAARSSSASAASAAQKLAAAGGAVGLSPGAMADNAETQRLLKVAQQQVEAAVKARLAMEKEVRPQTV